MEEKLNIKTNFIINTVAVNGRDIAEKAAYFDAILDSENFKKLTEHQQKTLTSAAHHLKVASSQLHEFFYIYDGVKDE